MSTLGLVLVGAPMFLLDASSLFPGMNALSPAAGAVLFIGGTKNHKTVAGQIASLRPVVFIGLISYSLYLWHWPLFAFARHIFVESDTPLIKTGLMLASLVLAFLSWKYIETPFRGNSLLKNPSAAIKFGIAVTALLLIVFSVPVIGKGFPRRFQAYSALLEDMQNQGKSYRNGGEGVIIGSRNKVDTDFMLWGDSHGMTLASSVDHIASELGLKGRAFLNSGSIPVTNLERSDGRRKILKYNRQVYDRITASGVTNLILVARWNNYLSERFVVDDKNLKSNADHAIASLSRQLPSMIRGLNEAGIRVFIIMQVPEAHNDMVAKQFFIRARFPNLNSTTHDRYTVPREIHDRKQAVFEQILKTLPAGRNIHVIDPCTPFFDNPQNRLEVYSERSHYRDENHLTVYGVEKYMAPVFKEIFRSIKAP
jgi:hypothetical protein